MKKGKWIAWAVAGTLAVGGLTAPVWKPAVERYANHVIQQQLDNALEGSVTYQSLRLDWDGSVDVRGVALYDASGGRVANVPTLSIALSLANVWKLPFSDESPLATLSTITAKQAEVWVTQSADGDWNINHIAKPSDPNQPMAFRGKVILQDATVHLSMPEQSVTLEHLQASLGFHTYPTMDLVAQTVVDNQAVTASGTLGLTDKAMNLSVVARDVHVGTYLKNLSPEPVTGKLDVTASVRGTMANLVVEGQVASRKLTYGDYEVRNLFAQLAYKNDGLHVQSLGAQVGDGRIVGTGTYDIQTQNYTAAIDAYAVSLSLLGHATGEPVSGQVSVSLRATGQGEKLGRWSVTTEGKDIQYNTVHVDAMALAASGNGTDAIVDYINAHIGDGTVTAYGQASAEEANLSVDIAKLPIDTFNTWLPKPMTGELSGTATVQGPWQNLTVQSHVASEGGTIQNEPFRQVYADVAIANHNLTITNGYLAGKTGSYHVEGDVGLTGNKNLNLTLTMDTVRLEHMLRPITDLPVTGWLSATTTIRGTADNPTVQGQAHMWDGSLYGKLISDVTLDYQYAGDTLSVPNMVVSAYGATYTGDGTMRGKDLDFTLTGNHIDTELLLREFPIKVSGIASMQGHVSGTLDHPVLEASVAAPTMQWNQAPVTDVVGNLYVDPTVVSLEKFTFATRHGGRYVIQGGMGLQGDKRLFGTATVRNGSLKELLAVADVSIPNLDGHLNGDVILGGTLKQPQVGVKGEITDTTIDQTVVGTSTINASLDGRKVTIKELKIPLQDGLIAAVGTADLDGDASIQIAASHAPVQLLTPLSGKQIDLTGKLNFIANISGKTNNPKVELSAELVNGVYNGVTIDQCIALATMQDKVIQLDQVLGKKGPYQIVASGTVPLAAFYTSGYLPPGAKNAMNVTIDMNGADLGALPLITPYITQATGAIRGKLHIDGTYDSPQLNGAVSVSNGSIQFKDVKKPLQNIQGSLWARGTHLELTTSGVMGKGSIGVSGTLDWQGRDITKYQAAVQSHELELQSPIFTGPLNAEVYVFERDGVPTVAGSLNLAHDTISIPMDLSSSNSTMPLALDFTVNAGSGVRLYNSVLYNMLVEGSAHFGGNTSYPMTTGGFKVVRGTLKYLNNQFTIHEGAANFEPGSLLPNLKLKATSRVQSYQIDLGLQGPLDQMEFSLSAEPRLSQEQIISLMTFGRESGMQGGLHSEDVTALLAAGIRSLAVGYLEDVVRDNLGLDLINITTGSISPVNGGESDDNKEGMPAKDVAGYYNLKIGKYIWPNFMLTWTRGLNNDQMSYGMQYDITRSLSVSAWMTNEHQSFIGGLWRYSF